MYRVSIEFSYKCINVISQNAVHWLATLPTVSSVLVKISQRSITNVVLWLATLLKFYLNNKVFLSRDYLNNRVFLSRNYRLIVAPRKFDVLKTNIKKQMLKQMFAREAKFRGQIC